MRHVILNFHGIGETAKEREPGESSYWIRPDFFSAVLERVVAVRNGPRIDLTFDDGNISDLLIGAEGLARHGMVATFFVLAQRIGRPECLSARDLTLLISMGHRIGSHGASHVDWTTLDASGLEAELDHARSLIESSTGQSITAAALPFGRYNRRIMAELDRRSYREVYSSDGGAVASPRLPMPRTSLRGDMTIDDIDTILLGLESPVRRARRALSRLKRRWT
jgi:peptidoglycan/xylan/chitin deacetylase (PgdA/CDA1 family)